MFSFRAGLRIATVALMGAVGFAAASGLAPSKAEARIFIGFGFGFPGFYGYPAYYGPYGYYPPPYAYYPPPPPYYAPPAPPPYPGYGAPAGYPGAAGYPAPGGPPRTGPAAAGAGPGGPAIAYTQRPAFRNQSGEECREYRSSQSINGRSTQIFGTACRDPNGQWRITN